MARGLTKITITIWAPDSTYNELGLEELARHADTGDCYCSKVETEKVAYPQEDPAWNDTEFFDDVFEQQDRECEEPTALQIETLLKSLNEGLRAKFLYFNAIGLTGLPEDAERIERLESTMRIGTEHFIGVTLAEQNLRSDLVTYKLVMEESPGGASAYTAICEFNPRKDETHE